MHHACVLDVLVVIFVACVPVHSSELRYVPQRHREHVFSSGVNHSDTLTWAVKLNLSLIGEDDVRNAVDAIAADTGLLTQGQIGSLNGHYVFSHPSAVGTEQASFSSLSFHSALRKISQDEQRQIKDEIHQKFDRHPFVEWYMLQRVVPRFKRTATAMPNYHKLLSVPSSNSSAVHFNDPQYPKQWHLVGISSYEIVLLYYLGADCYCYFKIIYL